MFAATRGGGRGRGQNFSSRGGQVGGRGRGRGSYTSAASDDKVQGEMSQLNSRMISTSESKKRGSESLEPAVGASAPSKFWSGDLDQNPDEEQEDDLDDPRKDENWKIQKIKGFMKDRDAQSKQS